MAEELLENSFLSDQEPLLHGKVAARLEFKIPSLA